MKYFKIQFCDCCEYEKFLKVLSLSGNAEIHHTSVIRHSLKDLWLLRLAKIEIVGSQCKAVP